MGRVTRLTAEDLRRETLRRQFPVVTEVGPAAALELIARLGPIQSQVPRAPFLGLAARLPGLAYDTVRDLFESFSLVKTTSIRGTVHTSDRRQLSRLHAVAQEPRRPMLRKHLGLRQLAPEAVTAEIEQHCAADWQPRASVVEHIAGWLTAHEGTTPDITTAAANLVWGHSGLLRRPPDQSWERRTDNFHRTARAVLSDLDEVDPAQALADLVATHLGSYGPVTRGDLAFFFGVRLGQVDAALRRLGDEVVRLTGPGDQPYLDLAEPPAGGQDDPGIRLLPEFDGLLLGFGGPQRTRFLDNDQLARVWAKVNGLFSPVVLADGRLVANWRTTGSERRTGIEVTMLPPYRPLAEDALAGPVTDAATALNLTVTEVRVRAAP